MRCPTLETLPPPPEGRTGWPWTEACDPLPAVNNQPRITIVIPSYNQADYIEETLRSILLQGYPNLELLVEDGASDDGTLEVLRRYDAWADWRSEPDRGQGHAINKGFARATGDVVTFISSDDLYLPGTFADVAANLKDGLDGVGAVIGAFRHVDAMSRPKSSGAIPPRLPGTRLENTAEKAGPFDLYLAEPESWRLHQEATFYVRKALDVVGREVREDLPYNMDRELVIRLVGRFPVILSPRCYASFRWHEESATTGGGRGKAHLEYAGLFAAHAAALPAAQKRQAQRVARRHQAKALLTVARYSAEKRVSFAALGRALLAEPSLVWQRRYLRVWSEALGIVGRPGM